MPPARAALGIRTAGAGPPVLWLHGYTMDSSLWRPLWDLLPGWRHVGVDLPGHGRSAPLRAGRTLPELAGEIAAVARAVGAERVVALSFGTSVALQLAIDEPGLVRRLIVGAPTIAGAPPEPGTGDRYRELAVLYRLAGPGEQMAELWMRSPPDIFRGTERHPQLRASLRKVIAGHGWDELATGAMYSLSRHSQPADVLRGIRAATLVISGDEDMPSFIRNAELLRRVVAGCRVLSLAEAGHLSLIERPEAAADAIAAHLRDPVAGPLAAPGIPSPGIASPGIPSPGIPSPGIASPGIPSPGIASPGITRSAAAPVA
jgi:pimeloyl-ACP methyl ester carboxylesterase